MTRPASAASRRRIARLYAATIGYDPFEDDPATAGRAGGSERAPRRSPRIPFRRDLT